MIARLLHLVAAVVIAVVVVVFAWSVTPPHAFKERVLARDAAGAVRALNPGG